MGILQTLDADNRGGEIGAGYGRINLGHFSRLLMRRLGYPLAGLQ